MKTCRNTRFANEQTYLDTICGRHDCDKPKPPPQHCEEYAECTLCTKCGKLVLRSDRHSESLHLDLHRKK